jgi:hypothetical protein
MDPEHARVTEADCMLPDVTLVFDVAELIWESPRE